MPKAHIISMSFSDYYPFGMRMSGTSPALATAAMPNDYLYNGKELVDDSGLYAYGFRYYDPTIARFTGVDPIADHANSQGLAGQLISEVGQRLRDGDDSIRPIKGFNQIGATRIIRVRRQGSS